MRQRTQTAAAALATGLCLVALFACAPASDTPAATPRTTEQWAELYPLQYGSFAVADQKSDNQYHSHYDLKTKLLAPAVRVQRPDGQLDTKLVAVQPSSIDPQTPSLSGEALYNSDGYLLVEGLEYDAATNRWYVVPSSLDSLAATRERQGCFSCKSSVFNEIYETNGAEALSQPMTPAFTSAINGQVWDCGTCHATTADGQLDPTADSQLFFWKQLARDTYDSFEPGERACGQCHNSLDHRGYITNQEVMDGFSPYRYGLGIDALYDAAIDDGIYTVDEATGIRLTCLDHPEIEITQGSPMRELGVTCIDCHMPALTSDEGETYTSHNASGSPLESEEALTYCLTCHASQGIESPGAMAQMVRDLQAETTQIATELQGLLSQAYDLIRDAVECGDVDEATLARCRDSYSRAEAYLHATTGTVGNEPLGTKIAHNPSAIASYNAQAKMLLTGVIQALG